MFYSHTVLAKKGPLATVWMAAHLETKIRKTLVRNTNINFSIDTIMFPEVPIALRLCGHLLLGVVRIYSKKVDYLFQDCNELVSQIRMLFAPSQINLPEDANCATYQSVTLPETFDLDSLEVDDIANLSMPKNDHVKPLEEITLLDQIPAEGVTYIPFFLNEDSTDSSSFSGRQSVGVAPMEEDTLPPFPVVIGKEIFPDQWISSPDPRGHMPFINENEVASTEKGMFHANGNQEVEFQEDISGVDVEKLHRVHIGNGGDLQREDLSPINDPLHVSSEAPTLVAMQKIPASASVDTPQPPSNHAGLEQVIPDFEHRPSPPVKRNKAKKRKLNNLYDEKIVLRNAEMSEQLKNSKKLLCKRRKLPCSTLDVWKLESRLHGDTVFQAPLPSGMCNKLKEICQDRYFAPVRNDIKFLENINVSPIECPRFEGFIGQEFFETEGASIALPEDQMQPCDLYTQENLMDTVGVDQMQPCDLYTQENLMDTVGVDLVLPPRQLQLDGHSEGHLSERVSPSGMEVTSPVLQSSSTCFYSSSHQHGTPQIGFEHTGSGLHLSEIPSLSRSEILLSEIPSTSRSPHSNDLNFLEAESTSEGSEMTVYTMSARTRAFARYLKESPGFLMPNGSRNLILNKILEGKKRKHSARMFFETLVLKSYGYIHAHQTEAYGDITISLTPALSKELP